MLFWCITFNDFCVEGLEEYEQQLKRVSALALPLKERTTPLNSRTFARVGLMGNPSDGFFGRTIAMSISNFWAEVAIVESEKLVLTPHKLNDPTEFGSLSDLHWISRKEG
jgi:glucuronokinase